MSVNKQEGMTTKVLKLSGIIRVNEKETTGKRKDRLGMR